MLKNFRPTVGASALLVATLPMLATAGETFLQSAESYTVRVRTSIAYAFAEDDAGTSNGAGFLVDKERGWILTNAHVSGRGTGYIEIGFKGQDFVEADIVYVDPELDFALLSTTPENLPAAATEADLDCDGGNINGAEVAAFGHPHNLYFSASRGIVSKVRFYGGHDWVQTDAAINGGNSGGPLINVETSKVVGINAMSLKDSEGLNFAVPMAPVCKALSLLRQGADPSPPLLPMTFAIDDELETYLTIAGNKYGPLPSVLRIGDRLRAVEGIKVTTPTEVATILRGVSGEARFEVVRGAKNLTFSIPFSQKPLVDQRDFILVDGAIIAEDFYLERRYLEKNFMIHSVRSGSDAHQLGLSDRELIIAVDGQRPSSLTHLYELLKTPGEKQLVTKHWSRVDNLFYDYYFYRFEPEEIDMY